MPKTLPADYPTTVEGALSLLKTAAEIDPLDTSKDLFLSLQLEQYAGTDAVGAVVFQPYFNAALFIWETPSRQIIHKAGDGVEFNRSEGGIINEPAIRSLIAKQIDFNTIYGITPAIDLSQWLERTCNLCNSERGYGNRTGLGAFVS